MVILRMELSYDWVQMYPYLHLCIWWWCLFSLSVVSNSLRLCATLRTAARQASLSFTVSWSLLTFMSTESMMLSNHLILCRPLLLLPSVFPSIRVFSGESALHIILWHCWPSSFSFSLCPHVLISTFAAWMKSHSFLTLLTAPLFPSWGQKKKIIWF